MTKRYHCDGPKCDETADYELPEQVGHYMGDGTYHVDAGWHVLDRGPTRHFHTIACLHDWAAEQERK